MDVHKKFTFDDPEDDYWNQSSTNDTTSIFFDDPKDAANEARQALDLLAESREIFTGCAIQNDETSSIAESDKALSEFEFASKLSITSTPAKVKDVSINFNDSASSYGDTKNELTKNAFSTASIVSEGSAGSYNSEVTVHLDYSRLKTEHRKLQKHLEKIRSERYRAPEIIETIKRLKSCDPVSLDFYRSRQQKVDLLDAAIDSLDKDVIVTIVLFLKKSLTKTIFREILIFKPEASNYYISYLKEANENEELIDTLFSLGRSDEAAIYEFLLSTKNRQIETKIQSLKKCLISGFSDPTLQYESNYVKDYINLLERQIPIDLTDNDMAKTGQELIFKQFPKKVSLIGQPLLTTLYYCCLYHYDLPKNSYASPLSIKEFFNLSEKEYLWMAISALSRLKRYDEIEKLISIKKVLTPTKIVCPFSWILFFGLIFKYGTPPKDYMNRWIRAITDLEERLKICEMTTEAREIQIETLIALKDRQKLSTLITKMIPHTAEHSKAHLALANNAYKWKN